MCFATPTVNDINKRWYAVQFFTSQRFTNYSQVVRINLRAVRKREKGTSINTIEMKKFFNNFFFTEITTTLDTMSLMD